MEFITKDNHKIYLNCPGPYFCDWYMLMESFSEYGTNILVVVDPNVHDLQFIPNIDRQKKNANIPIFNNS